MSGYVERAGDDPACAGRSGPASPLSAEAGHILASHADPVRRPVGAVLDLSNGPSDLRIVLVNQEGGALLRLGPFAEPDVIALWRSLLDATGLVPMLRRDRREPEALARQIGRLRIGPPTSRRRHVVLTGRRPRFLVRRRPAEMPAEPVVHRECEIAAGAAS